MWCKQVCSREILACFLAIVLAITTPSYWSAKLTRDRRRRLQTIDFSLLRLPTLRLCLPMFNSQVSLAIPVCAAVYLFTVYLLLLIAQRNRFSRPR